MSLSWFPLYHGDYLRDTGDLSCCEHGVYLLLLMRYFAQGPLPNDINRLCRLAAGSDAGVVISILERYWELVDGQWVNRRMEKVREETEQRHLERAESGRKGALTRWQKKIAEPLAKPIAEPLAEPMVTITTTTTVPNGTVKGRRFAPPSPQDVDNFAKEHGLELDAEAFVDFYASKGWKVGTTAMKDWHAAVRNWVRRQQGQAKKGNGASPHTREEWVAWGNAKRLVAKRGESLDAYVTRLKAAYDGGAA